MAALTPKRSECSLCRVVRLSCFLDLVDLARSIFVGKQDKFELRPAGGLSAQIEQKSSVLPGSYLGDVSNGVGTSQHGVGRSLEESCWDWDPFGWGKMGKWEGALHSPPLPTHAAVVIFLRPGRSLSSCGS
jgi:hypothetical protein